ncbi:MAG: DUF3822 family protein [Bacteroidota bacterium]
MTLTINKPKPAISHIDESISLESSAQYDLYLELGFDGITICVVDVNTGFSSALVHYQFQKISSLAALCDKSESIFTTNDIFKINFRKVYCSIINQKSTLVPVPVFEKGKEALLLGLNCSLDDDDLILINRFKQMDAVNIFAIPKPMRKVIQSHFPLAEFHHYSTALIENTLLENKMDQDKNVVLNIHPSHFEILIISQKTLLFYNTFNYSSAEDVLYYLLFVFEQFNISTDTIKVKVTGELDKHSSIYSLLYKYVRNINFGHRPASLKYCSKLESLPKHFYYSIYSLQLCV